MFGKKLTLVSLSIIAFAFLNVASSFASTLYLSPASGPIGQGRVKYVQVRLSAGGDAVNGVSAYLSYPADKLDVVSLSYGGSFSIAAEGSYGGGAVRVSRGNVGGVTGDVNVATIGFKGKAKGSAAVSFIGGSAAPRASDSSDSLNLGGSRGGTFTIVDPSTLPADIAAAGPKITDVSVLSLSTNSAIVTWKTDTKSDSTVQLGLEKGKYIVDITDTKAVTNHTLELKNALLVPGSLLHFRVKSKDSAKNESTSEDKQFQLKGYAVKLVILDMKSKPIANVTVAIYGKDGNKVTGVNGEVLFSDVIPGKRLITTKVNGMEKTAEVNVADVPTPQNFTLNFDFQSASAKSLPTNQMALGVAALVFLLLGIVFLSLTLKKKGQLNSENNPPFNDSIKVYKDESSNNKSENSTGLSKKDDLSFRTEDLGQVGIPVTPAIVEFSDDNNFGANPTNDSKNNDFLTENSPREDNVKINNQDIHPMVENILPEKKSNQGSDFGDMS